MAVITIAAVVAADASAEPEPELELEMMRARGHVRAMCNRPSAYPCCREEVL